MRRPLALSVLLLLAVATNVFAVGEARIIGKVLDVQTKQPIPGATIDVVALTGHNFKHQFPVEKDGSYAVYLLDGTIKYKFTFSAPGYTPYVEDMKLQLGNQNTRDITLAKAGAGVQSGTTAPSVAKADPVTTAYNAGVQLFNSDDLAGATAKFKEALAAKPDLLPAWEAMAKAQVRQKDYDGAIESANKALAIDAGETDMHAVLYEAYTAKGDKAKANEARKKLPADSHSLFNDAAKLINANKDAEAEPILKQAIIADEKFAEAYYELGMIDVRLQKNAEAKANLQKYLELQPKGKDAATAKEMLNYVK